MTTFTAPSGRPCHLSGVNKLPDGQFFATIRYEDGDREFKTLPFSIIEPYLP